ncbi:Sugar transporter [Spraguea lophii 42_110]|uniref:Sugar transporter n=1 Tax=Spraguea lophii (strain 42_110) TaxID=1358809 RepID=S7XFN5_SPRLO|nr:Sugar transporter [Spraguea lophii 42_110]
MLKNGQSKSSFLFSIFVSTITAFLFGINLTIIELLKKNFNDYVKNNSLKYILGIDINIFWSVIVGILFLGGLVGSTIAYNLNIRNKQKITTAYTLFLIGFTIKFIPKIPIAFLISRFILGVAIGISCEVVPVYISNVTPSKIKGVVGCIYQFNIVAGIIVCQALSYFFEENLNGMYVISAMIILSLFLVIGSLFIIDFKIMESSDKGLMALFKNKKSKLSIICAIIFHLGQQFSGISGVISFSNTIFKNTSNERLYTLCLGITKLIAIGMAMFVIESVGRKILMVISIILVTLGHILLMMHIHPFSGIFTFIIGFALGLGPVVWLICGDIFPQEYKSAGMFLSLIFNWVGGFTITTLFDILYKKFGVYSFSLYSVVMVCMLFFVLIVFKENKDKESKFLE